MPTTRAAVDQRLLPLLEHLARVGRRAAESSMAPGGLRARHPIALPLLSERGRAPGAGDRADRRRHIVELSPLGEDELTLAYARLSDVEDDLLSALSPDERATLYDLLVRGGGANSPPCDAAAAPPPCPL